MTATRQDIREWFDQGKDGDYDFMIVVCDTYDHGDYPVYAKKDDFQIEYDKHDGKNMQRIMESYDLHMDRETQLNEVRAHHYPANFKE